MTLLVMVACPVTLVGRQPAVAVRTSALVAPAVASAAAPRLTAPAAPRVAFTSDRDVIVAPNGAGAGLDDHPDAVTTSEGDVTALAYRPAAGAPASQVFTAFVSTSAGTSQVYLSRRDVPPGPGAADPAPPAATAITCSAGRKSHPAITTYRVPRADAPGGVDEHVAVAYAVADGGPSRVRVADVVVGVQSATGDFVADPIDCAAGSNIADSELPNQSGDDEWPTWGPQDGGLSTPDLVYSSTRDNPLGDLYLQNPASAAALRLTGILGDSGLGIANTQPAFAQFEADLGGDSVPRCGVLFTTTKFRPDGSLGTIAWPCDVPRNVGAVTSAWGPAPPQSSQPAVLESNAGADAVSFRTVATDPYGDIAYVGPARGIAFDAGSGFVLDRNAITVGAPSVGTAQSDPGQIWSDDGTEPVVAHTERALQADVGVVSATDPTDRTTLPGRSGTDDRGAPAYSPDGQRIAFSESANDGTATEFFREIVIADADGGNAYHADFGRSVDDAKGVVDFDTQPAWSPDGTSLGFVRTRYDDSGTALGPPQIWIGTLTSDGSGAITADTASPMPVPDAGRYYDEHPSWSPGSVTAGDAARIVFSRAGAAEVGIALATDPATFASDGSGEDNTVRLTATVRNNGTGTARGVQAVLTVPGSLRVSDPDPRCALAAAGSETTVTCTFGDIPAGGADAASLTLAATINCPSADNGYDITGRVATESPDFVTGNDSATAHVTQVADCVDITPTLATDPDRFTNADRAGITLTAGVENLGTATAQSVRAEVTVPSGLTVDAPPAGCTASGGGATDTTISCGFGSLAGGGSAAVDLTVRTRARCTPSTKTWTFGAHAATDSPQADTGNDDAATTATQPGGGGCLGIVQNQVSDDPPRGRHAVRPASALGPLDTTGDSDGMRAVPGLLPPDIPHLWIADPITGSAHVLQDVDGAPVVGRVPAWSPDGLRIAYEADGQLSIAALTAADGQAVAALTALTGYADYASGSGGTATPAMSVVSSATDPAWWPDGSALVFSGQPAGDTDQAGIYFVRPDGTGLRIIAQGDGPETEPTVQPFADLTVTLLATPTTLEVGQSTTLAATVGNRGTLAARDAVLTLDVPSGMSVTSFAGPATAPSPCAVTAAVVTCPLGTVDGGTTASVQFDAVGSTTGAKTFTSTATTPTPQDQSGDTATAGVLVTPRVLPPPADVAVSVTLSHPAVDVGQALTATIVVTDNGPAPAQNVTLTTGFAAALRASAAPACAAGGMPCGLGALAAGETRQFTVALSPGPVGSPPHDWSTTITATVQSTTADDDAANNVATAGLRVRQPTVPPRLTDVAVSISLARHVGYVGGPVTARYVVRNLATLPAFDVTLSANPPATFHVTSAAPCLATGCALGTLAPGARRVFALRATPSPIRPARGYLAQLTARVTTATAETDLANNSASATLPVEQPELQVVPGVAPSGYVTIAFADHVPPGSRVTLSWRSGITTDIGPYRVAPDGTAEAPVLVIRRDVLGVRLLQMRSTTGLFGSVDAALLVVPRSQAPPGFLSRG